MAKQKFKITSWKAYNNALITLGSLTFWGGMKQHFTPGTERQNLLFVVAHNIIPIWQ
ncbi:MAG: hypothetical protein G5663_07775 [Serratia symbiotica]|nr:hypothetical protein [Serratia symbiotica]